MSTYSSPRALNQALNSRFGRFAVEHPGRRVQDLQQQFAYDRLLARLFIGSDTDRWILKGSTALLARLSGAGRHTRDVDLYRVGDDDPHDVYEALRRATEIDLDDYFRFSLGSAQIVATAYRIPVEATLGVTRFARFPVDVVTNLMMTGTSELFDPPLPEIPGVRRVPYRVYPLADHVADKVCALHESHYRHEGVGVPSTRYRDLADLVMIARTLTVDAAALITAVRSEETRRRLHLAHALALPRSYGWERGYEAVARGVPDIVDVDLQSAISTASGFINPVLTGVAQGTWDWKTLFWR